MRTNLFELLTSEQQMSCGRPVTLCYLSAETESLEIVSKQILRSHIKRFAEQYLSRIEDQWYRKDLVFFMSC
jgi:hypothetical protein